MVTVPARHLAIIACVGALLLLCAFALAGGGGGLTYEGREADAAWRAEAEARIDALRKADIAIVVVDEAGRPLADVPVEVSMTRHRFGFGSAVVAKRLVDAGEDEDRYQAIVAHYFNRVVFENDLKWDPWNRAKRPDDPSYSRDKLDAALSWLGQFDIAVRGHYLAWGPIERFEAYKGYLDSPGAFREQFLAHVGEKLAAVGPAVPEWDFVNHPLGWNRRLLLLDDFVGRDVYKQVHDMARAAAPHARLVVNEGGILPTYRGADVQRQRYIDFIQGLRREGVGVDGIGFMAHFKPHTLTPPRQLLQVLDRFAELELPLQVTEFDIRFGPNGEPYAMTPDEARLQADYTRDFMLAVFSHPAVESLLIWGFWEGQHYNPSAALFDRDWRIRPNGEAFFELIGERWWTDAQGATDDEGRYRVRGFKGEYEIVIGAGAQAKRHLATVDDDFTLRLVHDQHDAAESQTESMQ